MIHLTQALVVVSALIINLYSSNAQSAKISQSREKSVSKVYQSEAGLKIPKLGFAIDAIYEPRLDNLIPGYKMINVVIANSSERKINFDVQKDRWFVIGQDGKKHKAINHLSIENERLWQTLPSALRENLSYPRHVESGAQVQLDLLFPIAIDLLQFKELQWREAEGSKQFVIYPAENNDFEKAPEGAPNPDSQSYQQATEKYGNTPKPPEPAPIPEFDPNLDNFSVERR